MRKIAIGICYFLPQNNYIENDKCIPIQLGYAETGVDMGIVKDNTFDNRSDKHPIYSEYSGVYWIWKNVDAEYKGILQHRRFFTLKRIGVVSNCRQSLRLFKNYIVNLYKYAPHFYCKRIECNTTKEYLEEAELFLNSLPTILLNDYGIITTTPYRFVNMKVKTLYDDVVNRTLLSVVKECISTINPSMSSFFYETINGSRLYYSNLVIMTSTLFDEYCRFVFDVFDSVEKKLVDGGYYINPCKEKSLYRVFGYIGELLTNTYILKKKSEGIKIKECNVLFNKEAIGNEKTNYNLFKP